MFHSLRQEKKKKLSNLRKDNVFSLYRLCYPNLKTQGGLNLVSLLETSKIMFLNDRKKYLEATTKRTDKL